MERYTYGHSFTAADRLKRIADFFNPLSYNFIRENLGNPYGQVVDMGCGPGYTTDMLAQATQAKEVFGIDISKYFVEVARKNYPDYTFATANVTHLNSTLKYDMIYCRFLLSHLRDIQSLFKHWSTLLNPGGYICIDELEDIFTENTVFKRYLEINTALIRSQGADLFIGRKLNNFINGFQMICDQSDTIPVKDYMAAGWFYPNTISIWETEEYVKRTVNEDEKQSISAALLRIHEQQKGESNITWKMKRIIVTKQTYL